MRISLRSFLMGLGVGAAVAMLLLEAWGSHYSDNYFLSAQPRLARPFLQQHLEALAAPRPVSKPWLPGSSSAPHDNWQFTDLSGKTITLAAFKGKVVFLDIWATYCAPCVWEMPHIQKLAASLQHENVAFVLVAKDGKEAVQNFLKKQPLDLPIYLASAGPPDLPSEAIPATYILDRSGAAAFQYIGAANWDDDSVLSYLRSLENR